MFKLGLGKHSAASGPVAEADPFGNVLAAISEDLVQLNQTTEKDFLAIGAKLHEFTIKSRDLSKMAGQVMELTSGSDLQTSIHGLGNLLGELEEHLNSLEQQFEESIETLKRYQDVVGRVESSSRDFRQMIINLNMLGFLTKVENSHLFSIDSGFTSLAEDVKKLADNIRNRSQEIIEQSARLASMIALALARVQESETKRRRQARQLMEITKDNHQALIKRQQQAADVARGLEGQAAAIAASVAEIVSGLQFNDITRQQLEHVAQALDGLREAIGFSDHEASIVDKAGATLEIVGLQNAQAEHARRELYEAVEDVRRNLGAIGNATVAMLASLKMVSWSGDTDGRNFMAEINSGMDSIIAGLSDSNHEQSELSGTMNDVSNMVEQMAGFVEDIERLGVELQLIALNARIKAARIGNEGLTLDTISGSIYELSTNSRNDTRTLAEMLHDLVGMAQEFNAGFAADKQLNQDLGLRLSEQFDSAHQTLNGINDRVLDILGVMNSSGGQMVSEIGTLCGSIVVHETVAGVLDKQNCRMRDLIATAEELCAGADVSHRPQYLEQLSRQYTMDSERRIHDSHVSGDVDEFKQAVAGSADDLGDNVDLF